MHYRERRTRKLSESDPPCCWHGDCSRAFAGITNSRVGRAFRLNHGASGSWPGKPRRSYSNFAGAKGKQLGRGPGPGINEFADWNDVTQKDKDLPI
jgi:hypothetical protein